MNHSQVLNKINSYITYAKLQNITLHQSNNHIYNSYSFNSQNLHINIIFSNKIYLEARIYELNNLTQKTAIKNLIYLESNHNHKEFFNKLDNYFNQL